MAGRRAWRASRGGWSRGRMPRLHVPRVGGVFASTRAAQASDAIRWPPHAGRRSLKASPRLVGGVARRSDNAGSVERSSATAVLGGQQNDALSVPPCSRCGLPAFWQGSALGSRPRGRVADADADRPGRPHAGRDPDPRRGPERTRGGRSRGRVSPGVRFKWACVWDLAGRGRAWKRFAGIWKPMRDPVPPKESTCSSPTSDTEENSTLRPRGRVDWCVHTTLRMRRNG